MPGAGPPSGASEDPGEPLSGAPPAADLGPRALAAAGWAVFVLLAIDRVGEGPLARLDDALLAAVPHEGPLHATSSLLTHVGDPITLVALTLLGTLLLLRERSFLDAGLLPLAKAISATVIFGLKAAFGRARPGMAAECCAFPSGHATDTAMVLMLLAVMLFEQRRKIRPWAEGVAMGLAVVVGLTRLVLSVHWPTDVLAGWGLGWGLAGTFLLLRAYLRRRIRLPWAAGEATRTRDRRPLTEVQPTQGPGMAEASPGPWRLERCPEQGPEDRDEAPPGRPGTKRRDLAGDRGVQSGCSRSSTSPAVTS